MKLTLRNIAKLKNADVEINGITVIAGENNTGKSTVGKALYSVFNSLYNLEEQINTERKTIIIDVINSLYVIHSNRASIFRHSFEIRNVAERLIEYQYGIEDIKNILTTTLADDNLKPIPDEIQTAAERIKEIIDVTQDSIFETVLLKNLSLEFNGQINNIYTEEKGIIELLIKDKTISISVFEDKIDKIENAYSLKTEAVYIDDPFILDEVTPGMNFHRVRYMSHRLHLVEKLSDNEYSNTVIDEIIASKKLDQLYSKIDSVCSGDIVSPTKNTFGYKKVGTDKILNVKNISAGVKTFVILKTLLKNGTLQRNGTIILDEPEIHLHPQWQLVFAELIVLLHKEFDMNILMNTHSPYFLKAIEAYSAKHSVADKCKYYLAHAETDMSVIDDVTNDTEKIYRLLARPLQDLENVVYDND